MPQDGEAQVGASDANPRRAASPGASCDSAERERKRLKAERREKKRSMRDARAAAGADASPAAEGDQRRMTDARDSEQVSVNPLASSILLQERFSI